MRCLKFDNQEKAALRALDDFTIAGDGETATVEGRMEVTIIRPAIHGGNFWVTFTLPSGKQLNPMILSRAELLELAGIKQEAD
jgi:hypothetical protein